MKKLNLCIITLAVAAMCFVSCKKEENDNSNGIHFTATISTDTKTALSGSTINWVTGDAIKIFGTNTSGWIYTATPQSTNSTWADFAPANGGNAGDPITNEGFTAIYPANAAVNSTTFTIPAEQSYATDQIVNFPMYGKSTTDPYKLVFKNLCGALKIRLKGTATVTGIKVTANTYINGDYTIGNDGSSISLTEGTTNHTNSTTLSCNQQLSSTDYRDFYVFLPAGNYTYMEIKIFSNDGKTSTQKLGNGTTLNVTRSKYTLISFNPSFVDPPTPPTGALSGLFTVNTNGDKVRFSQGNLIKTNNTTYAFCNEQNHYTESNATAYLHTGARSYSGLNITNGGGTNNTWRGISLTDITGICNYRTGISCRATYRWALVKVNGTGGLLLFPDYFYWPSDNIPEPAKKNQSLGTSDPQWNNINYTDNQWQALEDAGCVFLPSYQDESRYWTTTIRMEGNRYQEDPNYQYYIKFSSKTNTFAGSTGSSTSNMSINSTNAVRLIMNVTSTSTK